MVAGGNATIYTLHAVDYYISDYIARAPKYLNREPATTRGGNTAY